MPTMRTTAGCLGAALGAFAGCDGSWRLCDQSGLLGPPGCMRGLSVFAYLPWGLAGMLVGIVGGAWAANGLVSLLGWWQTRQPLRPKRRGRRRRRPDSVRPEGDAGAP